MSTGLIARMTKACELSGIRYEELMDSIAIKNISAEAARPLRQIILRPGRPIEESVYPLDEKPDSLHLGAYHQKELVGIASFFKEAASGASTDCYRLRGMAVLPAHQGKGIGKKLLGDGINQLTAQGAVELWCNARTTASRFYFSFGFKQDGGEFELPGIGPHFLLRLSLKT